MKPLLKKQRYIGSKTQFYLSLFSIFYFLFSFSQEKEQDSTKVTELKEIVLTGTRATGKNPITFSNVTKEEIAPRNLGQDIPILMNFLPSVVTTSDAGNGVGYTYMRVRGSDGSRINVTLNGIPFNDSESQGTFFVNLPDFASSLESVQLQRGVGTSTNGAGAFGASLNMQTKFYSENAFVEIANSVGSFGTRKHTLNFSSGLHQNFEMNARVSQIASDGFIDRAASNMFGYHFNLNYVKENSLVKFLAFGGKEKTYQAWYGIEDKDKLENDRTYNFAGLYFDEFGNEKFYDNETDNYWQNHFQLHWSKKWNKKWNSNIALHYTLGKGYFEQYKEDENLEAYNLPVVDGNSISDLVRKRWLDNDFFGATFSLNYRDEKTNILLGGAKNRYLGNHYGEVVWTQNYIPNPNLYYDNFGNKDELNIYSKITQNVTDRWSIYTDLQYRKVVYEATSFRFSDVNDVFNFFNPKAGFNFQYNDYHAFYGYFGIANKEPRRDDYENGSIKSERLYDYELGWKFNKGKIRFYANAFYMKYNNQLVMTGALNDVGSPIFTNSGKSFRVGIEIESMIQLGNHFLVNPNITWSQNKNQEFNFQRDGILQNLGNTTIAFSPELIFGNRFTYLPIKNFQISLLSKYVSDQYMGNIDSKNSILNAFFVNDVNVSYDWNINKSIKSITFSGLVNNLFNVKYESNGYFYTYDDDWSIPESITTIEGTGYYPQAGINFLLGINAKF